MNFAFPAHLVRRLMLMTGGEAMQSGFQATASYILQSATSLPLSYSVSHTQERGGLFGCRILQSDTTRHNVDMSFWGVASAGIHFQQQTLRYKKNGFEIERQSHGVGAHASVGSWASVGAGWNSGYEQSAPKTWTEGEFSFNQSCERSFEGQFTANLRLGDRGAFVDLPAWKESKVTRTFKTRTDGKPLSTREKLKLKFLAKQEAAAANGMLQRCFAL